MLFGSSNWLYIILIGFIVGVLAPVQAGQGPRIILTIVLGIAGALLGAIAILLVVELLRRRPRRLP